MHEEPELTVRYVGTWRPACTDCQHVQHPSYACDEAARMRDAWNTVINQALNDMTPPAN